MLICVCLSPYVYIIITFICMHSFVCVCIDCLYIKDMCLCVYMSMCVMVRGDDCLCELDHTLKALSVQ